jgi:hypothetical protein
VHRVFHLTQVLLFLWHSSLTLQAEFPVFREASTVLQPEQLRFNPTGELIFPSVIRTDKLENPRGRFYLYYAPHDNPGGICLAYADQLEGPWTEYAGNPVIGREWADHYRVSHVSSPHALWMEREGRLFLWFHGENRTTRYASSRDGLRFEYEGVAIEATEWPSTTEASYARVFADPAPGAEGYVMFLMGNQARERKIFLARSPDGRAWTAQAEPFFEAPADAGARPQTSGPWLWQWRDRFFVLAHADFPDEGLYSVYAMETDARLSGARYAGKLLRASGKPPEFARVAAPALIEEGGRLYLFYEAGARSRTAIRMAVAEVE